MGRKLQFRAAVEGDCTHLTLIRDMAGRRMPAYLWSQEVTQGQSCFEYGREKIRTDATFDAYFKNWQVAQAGSAFVGAFFGFLVADPYPHRDMDAVPKCFRPCVELEKVASGAWMLQAIALLPEYRGQGFSGQLLDQAARVASNAGTNRVALQVEEVNSVALQAYMSNGFVEVDRRPYVHFPGSQDSGDVILMCKEINR